MMAKTKVLVITGDRIMLRLLQQNLSQDDYEVASTQHTDELLKAVLDIELPDIIILDIMMPGLDGIEVCLYIRQWSQVPIMMLSAWGAGPGKLRGLDLGADSYLTEPFDIYEMMSRIRAVAQRNYAGMNLLSNIHSGI